MTDYRRDIDGLRAVAVLAVVLFHVGVGPITGGFVGVDVFFVISGYLITTLLVREHAKHGRISLLDFYARRIRRLFPALAVVVLLTVIAGYFVLLPVKEQPALARSVYMTAIYLSNLHFQRETNDYFAGPAAEQPLLHTWSLAVEEQYYLVWPAILIGLLWLATKTGAERRRIILAGLGLLACGSLGLSIWWTRTAPGAAFYHLPARAWELGLGAIVAVAMDGRTKPNARLGDAATGLGLVMIGAAIVVIDRTTPFPGYAAALPVVGAALCIAGGGFGSSIGRVVLGNRVMVAIGKVSYSWYLWHWPMLALARARAMSTPDPVRDGAIAVASLALAFASTYWVENPIRFAKSGPLARRGTTILAGAAVSGLLVLAGFGLAFAASHAAKDPRYAELVAIANQKPPLPGCQSSRLPPRAKCTLPGTDTTREIVIWGDSHAERVVTPVAAYAQPRGIPVVQRTNAACPPMVGVVPSDRGIPNKGCKRFNAKVLDELRADRDRGIAVTVVLVGRWTNYLATTSLANVPTRTLFDVTGTARGAAPLALLEAGLDRTLAELDAIGVRTVVAAPFPELRHSPAECHLRLPAPECVIARSVVETYRAPALATVRAVTERHSQSTRLVDPIDLLCTATTCSPVLDGHLVYVDAHHLTHRGTEKLVDMLAPALTWAAP